jgi:hypothetical protein
VSFCFVLSISFSKILFITFPKVNPPATQLQESLNKKKKKNEGLKPKRLIINSNAKNTPQEEIITKGFKINEELQNLLNGLNDFKDKEENK